MSLPTNCLLMRIDRFLVWTCSFCLVLLVGLGAEPTLVWAHTPPSDSTNPPADTTQYALPQVPIAQDGVLRVNDQAHRFLERQQTLDRLPRAVLSHQPLSWYEVGAYLDSLHEQRTDLSPNEQRHLDRYREGPDRSTRRLYANGFDMYSTVGDWGTLNVNPLLYSTIGGLEQTGFPNRDRTMETWRGTAGLRVRGRVWRHFFYDGQLTANRVRPPRAQMQTEGRTTVPRRGAISVRDDRTYDYADFRGVVGFRSRFFEVRFGRDQNRWGHGPGSVMLSNFSAPYNQLQIRTSFWRVQYTNLFTRYAAPAGPSAPDEEVDLDRRPKSYGASHRLAINLSDRFEVGLFETIVMAPERDSTVTRTGYDIAFLNPLIFLRAVERELGSPDRAIVGIDAGWVATPGLRLYGQFILDELDVNQIGQQWWGNKWAWMVGAHWVPPSYSSWSVRGEFARLRPYIYAHTYVPNAYAHWDDGLGYPTGPNSIDVALIAEYDPPSAWHAAVHAAYTVRGRNTADENFGSDATRSNQTRVSSNNVPMLHGVRQTQWTAEGYVGVELLPQLLLEGAVRAEVLLDAERDRDRYLNPSIGLRWGLPFDSRRY